MCDIDHATREWRFYLHDVIGFDEKVRSYSAGMDQELFVADGRAYDAALRSLNPIPATASHIPIAVCEAHPEIPWSALIRTPNRFRHGYPNVRDSDIRSFLRNTTPPLLPALSNPLAPTDKDQT